MLVGSLNLLSLEVNALLTQEVGPKSCKNVTLVHWLCDEVAKTFRLGKGVCFYGFSCEMNPLTNVKNIKKLSEEELKGRNKKSWHDQYKGSAWVFVGGLPYELTEGDIICVFSQFGEPININLVRDKDSGKSKGFCFICYEDQRSTNLAVDNLNGVKILGRTIRVDHVENYKPPKISKSDENPDMRSKIKKEKTKGEESSGDSSDNELEVKKKKKRKAREKGDSDVEKTHRKKKKRKVHKKQKKRKESLSSEDEKKMKRRKAESSSSSSKSLSPSSSSSSSSDVDTSKKEEKKRSRTIEDLKREARLIQEELKRRQQEQEKKKQGERKSRSRSEERRRTTERKKERSRGQREEKRRNKSRSPTGPGRRRSKSRDRNRENGQRRLRH